jgi:hypothetical protein
MPEGHAERGVEANTNAHLVRSVRHAESMDGAEPSGSIASLAAIRCPSHASPAAGAVLSRGGWRVG